MMGYFPKKKLTNMVEIKSKQVERVEKRPGDQIGPDEANKLRRNSKKTKWKEK